MAGSSSDEEERTILDSQMAFSNSSSPARLTLWRQSLLFNGNGYTVYDDLGGGLVFRVDNYASNWKQEMFLMDFSGHVLFTICRRSNSNNSNSISQLIWKKLSILESWEAFKGDKEEGIRYGSGLQKPFMVATKAFSNSCCNITVATGDKYLIKWSCREGWSKIFPAAAAAATLPIAQISKKFGTPPESSSLGKDVFTLTVQQGVDQAIIMTMVMISYAMR
ncbi:protein LURP-one-related 11-like [Macadamia integrifolia]|uniref:protein LURP-one-related 11-like n=1 Tax=Macadamia integrifolia TaxID=60698 RepID=UPI001C52AC7C|nr:protein LURP-one-related 11-like [Macadamia integrifolia]